jgi:hypothetical protein
MNRHVQPIHALVPGVNPFIGDAPEDRHAERVVREALTFLDTLTKALQPRLNEAMLRGIGGSPRVQARRRRASRRIRLRWANSISTSDGDR